MAALGWALTSPGSNLVLSASDSGAVQTLVGHLLLLGVGRCWWIMGPTVWLLLRFFGV